MKGILFSVSFFIIIIPFSVIASSGKPPNHLDLVKQVVGENSQARESAKNHAYQHESCGISECSTSGIELIDRVVQKLHAIDPRFGYSLRHAHGNVYFQVELAAYYMGDGEAHEATSDNDDIYKVGALSSRGEARWRDRELTVEHNRNQAHQNNNISQWVYPRPDFPNAPFIDYYGDGSSNNNPEPITPPEEGSTIGEGSCGDTANTCESGSFHAHPRDTATEHRWTCRHVQGQRGGERCSKPRSEDGDDENLGRCGNTANTCQRGDLHDHPPDTDTEIIWTCRNRGVTYTQSNGEARHSGEIRCAISTSGGEVRAVDTTYYGNSGDGGSNSGNGPGNSGGTDDDGNTGNNGGGTGGDQSLGLEYAKQFIRDMSREHREAFRVADNSYPSGGRTRERSEFQDRVIQKLHALDGGFGYVVFPDGRFMTDLICYVPAQHRPSSGASLPNRAVNFNFSRADFIAGGPDSNPNKRLFWRTEEYTPDRGRRCVYPRPGAPDYGYGN